MTSTPLDSFRQDRPLAESIAVATRGIHARLNKLIVARLPLVLPPQADDPFVYASGLLHITPIYTTFESLWREIVHEPPQGDDPETPNPRTPIVREVLDLLYAPGLLRADRLVADIQSMTGCTEAAAREQLAIVAKTGHLAEVVSHIRRAIQNRPHVLLAYSYIMYMALFAGGRFIRATLESAGESFWHRAADQESPDVTLPRSHGSLPLRFFHFDTPEDGEDLKREYKQKLTVCEEMLSYREKHDIVQEAICIFENMILVVRQLDSVTAPGNSSTTSGDSLATVITNPLAHRFRDSVAVTRERSARGSSNRASGVSSSSSSGSDCEHDSKSARSLENLPRPDSHPTMPSVTGVELCPGLSKSMRFEKTLPHPLRVTPTVDSTSDLTESLKMASKRLDREQISNWALGIAIGMVVVGMAIFSGRRTGLL